ncbi:MAG: hypothetical protein ABW250_04585, partial [Pyrinomonadaceae bacterium]
DARADSRARVELPWVATPGAEPPAPDRIVRLLAPRPLKVEASGGVVEFDCLGRRWRFAEEAAPVLKRLSERRACTIAELHEAARGRLPLAKVQAFASELALHGLVAFEPDAGETAADETGEGGA